MILGENFFPLLILAFGAALVVGTTAALVNKAAPQPAPDAQDIVVGNFTVTPAMAMKIRSGFFIVCGAIMVAWALASLN